MIPWVDDQCRAWGAHKRWLLTGDDDGWPERSPLGKLIEEGPGAGHGSTIARMPIKDPPVAYRFVTIALTRMAATHELERPIEVVGMHYLLRGKARGKAEELGISTKQYWTLLHTAHAFMAGYASLLDAMEGCADVPRGEVCTLERFA